ncbi:MAG: DUF3127 domain-containing protein [Bacteroidales bacterium]|jgi:hypothetical protein|nr:DUF3127 domain-containing protein [Bacteroidales bacterium]
MEIKGKLFKKLPVQTGQGRNGEWRKQEIVLELEGNYPKKVCIAVWGDKINVASLQEGATLNAFVDVESREWQDKWFTDVKAWKIDVLDNAGTAQQAPPSPQTSDVPPIESFPPPTESGTPDDLPF